MQETGSQLTVQEDHEALETWEPMAQEAGVGCATGAATPVVARPAFSLGRANLVWHGRIWWWRCHTLIIPTLWRWPIGCKPDVIAVFGTSLIRGPLLAKGRLGIFNLHGGLSPRYRGADCTFWALYNGEPDQVGCTLHMIDAGIDTGNLIAHICPEVREGDDELTLFWRAVRDSADVYVELLDRLARGERLGQPQSDKGRLYQVKQRGWREERHLAAQMDSGLLRGLNLPRRVRWFVTKRSLGQTAQAG